MDHSLVRVLVAVLLCLLNFFGVLPDEAAQVSSAPPADPVRHEENLPARITAAPVEVIIIETPAPREAEPELPEETPGPEPTDMPQPTEMPEIEPKTEAEQPPVQSIPDTGIELPIDPIR